MRKAIFEEKEKWLGYVDIKELEHKVDNASADVLKKYLDDNNLRFRVISEEGFKDQGPSGELLIVDPIDGTRNFVKGVPFSSISIAVAKSDTMDSVYLGVVRDIFRNDVYWAIKGEGAYKNGVKINVSRIKKVYKAQISLSITLSRCGASPIHNLLPYIPFPRYLGSAALETCFVGEGVLDGYVDIRDKLRVFDIAAGQLIVKEAGGKIIIWQNRKKEISLSSVHGISIIAVSTPHLLEAIMDILRLS
jgi:fructose-1,6-bisphosphatase/inositol monophosphatase family enzyme